MRDALCALTTPLGRGSIGGMRTTLEHLPAGKRAQLEAIAALIIQGLVRVYSGAGG